MMTMMMDLCCHLFILFKSIWIVSHLADTGHAYTDVNVCDSKEEEEEDDDGSSSSSSGSSRNNNKIAKWNEQTIYVWRICGKR